MRRIICGLICVFIHGLDVGSVFCQTPTRIDVKNDSALIPKLPDVFEAEVVEKYVRETARSKGFIGLEMVVIRQGKVEIALGSGKDSLPDGKAVLPETPFAIGSVSKQFTCAAILLLAQDGKLSPMDKVAKWYPKISNADRVTLLDLMNHTSGYPDYYPLDFLDRRMIKPINLDDLIRDYAGGKPDFAPGEKYSYSNTGYSILGRVVEKVSGKSLGEFFKERIFEPLDMKTARLDPPAGFEGLPKGYRALGIEGNEWAPPEAGGWLHGAGGIYASANDLGKWGIALMSGKLLNAKSLEIMTKPRILNNGKKRNYGCGLTISDRDGEIVWGHSGAVSGFHANILLVPRTRSVGVLLVNSEHLDDGQLFRDVMNLLLREESNIPKVSGPSPIEQAKLLVAQLACGKLVPGNLGEEYRSFMSNSRVEAYSRRLRELGEPLRIELESVYERGGMEVALLKVFFKNGTILKGSLYRTPDGRIQQFLLSSQ